MYQREISGLAEKVCPPSLALSLSLSLSLSVFFSLSSPLSPTLALSLSLTHTLGAQEEEQRRVLKELWEQNSTMQAKDDQYTNIVWEVRARALSLSLSPFIFISPYQR